MGYNRIGQSTAGLRMGAPSDSNINMDLTRQIGAVDVALCSENKLPSSSRLGVGTNFLLSGLDVQAVNPALESHPQPSLNTDVTQNLDMPGLNN